MGESYLCLPFEPLSAYIWAIQPQILQAQHVRKWTLYSSPQVSSSVCERTPSFSTKNLMSSLLFSRIQSITNFYLIIFHYSVSADFSICMTLGGAITHSLLNQQWDISVATPPFCWLDFPWPRMKLQLKYMWVVVINTSIIIRRQWWYEVYFYNERY